VFVNKFFVLFNVFIALLHDCFGWLCLPVRILRFMSKGSLIGLKILIVEMRLLLGFVTIFLNCLVRQGSNECFVIIIITYSIAASYTYGSPFELDLLDRPSSEENPTSPLSSLLLLSAMLSVSMSHSLSSGMFPGFVRIV